MPRPPTTSPGNSLERVRRRNLARVLTLVHEGGVLPRSALTRSTGLNRSTIGALVQELAELGLVREGLPAASTGVGRPSPTVSASGDVVAIAVNPEIDAVTVAVVGLDGTEHSRVRRALDRVPTAEEVATMVAELVPELATSRAEFEGRVIGIGVAVPGIVRTADGVVRIAPHLGWREEPFAERLALLTGLPVVAANDADLGVRAEHLAGSARGHDHIVYLNGGASGIGSGIIEDGRVLAGRAGYAGELGHTLVDSTGLHCHCGSIGCLETVVSQASLLAAADLGRDAGEQLAVALADPGPRLAAEVDRQLGFLAIALRNVIVTVNPELVVLGGFLGALHDHASDRLDALVTEQTMPVLREGVVITRTQLGSAILLRGAAELVFEGLLADPVEVVEATRSRA